MTTTPAYTPTFDLPPRRGRNGQTLLPDWTPPQVDMLHRLRADGYSMTYIAAQFMRQGYDISPSMVTRKCRELGLNRMLNSGFKSGTQRVRERRQASQAAAAVPI